MKRLFTLLILPFLLFSQKNPEAETASKEREPWTVGVALSGGAALGLAHVGVLKVLEEEGIPISYISGTSMGAIVAGMYAAGYTPAQMDSILTTVDWSALFSERIPQNRMSLARREEGQRNLVELTHHWFVPSIPSGVVSLQNVEIMLTDFLARPAYYAGYDFDSLAIPFRCAAADVATGEARIFNRGSLVDAIRASIAIPGVFSPARIEGRAYIDGGAVLNLPVEPLLAFEPDFIIASDVIRWTTESRSIIDVVQRSMAIVTEQNRRQQRKKASVVVYPNVDEFLPSDFGKAEELVAAGEATARIALPALAEKLSGHPLVLERNPLYPRPTPVVGDVKIKGLGMTRQAFVRRSIYTKEGDSLDFGVLVGDLERLRETGLFRHVSHRLEFSDSLVDVVYILEEKDYGIYGLGVYYDNVYGFALRLEVAQVNLLGTGARLGLAAVLGEPQDVRVGISGARLFILPFTYRLEGYRNLSRHSYYESGQWRFDYRTRTWGAEAEFGYGLGKNSYFTLGYLHRYHSHRLPPLAGDEQEEMVTGPTGKLRFCNLDDLGFPNRGFDLGVSGKFGLPTPTLNRTFFKAEAKAERYTKIGENVVLGLTLAYGAASDSLPRAEKFRLGGPGLMGSRQEEFEIPEYAAARIVLAYHLFDLFNNKRYPFRVELLTDLAAFNPILYSRGILEQTFMGAGVGVGADTPAGPVRASLGLSASRRVSFNLAVGTPPGVRL